MAFKGWPVEAVEFYEGLEADNSRAYWHAHKTVYDEQVKAPMEALLVELEGEFGAGRVFIFDTRNGNFVRAYVQALDSGLDLPTGFDFMPGDLTDCNANQIPDTCDIASGFSSDINANGVPDECERTCYANCDISVLPPVLNVNDFACFLNQYAAGNPYANCDGSTLPPSLNVNDFICFTNLFAAGCP